MGKWVVVRKGDLIEAERLKDFIYDQGEEACTIENQDRCNDQFSYIPYGSWTGEGEYQVSKINLTPVFKESSVGVLTAGANKPMEVLKEEAVAKETASEEECLDNTPLAIVLIVLTVSLMVPIVVLASKIKDLNQDAGTNELQDFDSTLSKKTLKLEANAESVEKQLQVMEESVEGQVPNERDD